MLAVQAAESVSMTSSGKSPLQVDLDVISLKLCIRDEKWGLRVVDGVQTQRRSTMSSMVIPKWRTFPAIVSTKPKHPRFG